MQCSKDAVTRGNYFRLCEWALVPICRKRAASAAASEGRLAAAASNNPFAAGKTDTTLSATADEPDIQAEAAAMAILAAERLAQLLDYNAERLGPRAGLKVGNGLVLRGASAVFPVCGPCRGKSYLVFWHVQEIAGSLMGLLYAAASSN